MLHLDVAPSNIVLHHGHGLLIDFNVAREAGEHAEVMDGGCGRLAFKSIARLGDEAAALPVEGSALGRGVKTWWRRSEPIGCTAVEAQ